MESFRAIAARNQQKAWEIIRQTNIISIWESIGAEINLVGSLRTGLLCTHHDIDFHIYSSPLQVADSFRAMAALAENPRIRKIEYTNLAATEEACLEWHAWYEDAPGECWKLDMIHIRKGSRYDGYFEKVAEQISAVLTDEQKEAILRLKYQTPATEELMGIVYYQAVIRDGVRTYAEFETWKKQHPVTGIIEWMPG